MRHQTVYYVYALKDIRFNPPKTFYIGKGTGTRAWEHELKVDKSSKGKRIKDIHEAGQDVLTVKLVEGVSEVEALRIEAELIGAFGTEDRGGLLTNRVVPSGLVPARSISCSVPDGTVEKAQVSLELLKSAVMEILNSNADGLKNYDVAKCLGLQSDYGGGSKNYLSYSLLGILMREGKVRRLNNEKHISLVR